MEEEQRKIKHIHISDSLNLRTIIFTSYSLSQNLPIILFLYQVPPYQQKENRSLQIPSSVLGAWAIG